MKKVSVSMLTVLSAHCIIALTCIPHMLCASAAKPAPVEEVSEAEIDRLIARTNQAVATFSNLQAETEADCVALEKINDELLGKAQLCKKLAPGKRATIEKGHTELLQALYYTRSRIKKREGALRMATQGFRAADLQGPLHNRFRTLAQDCALTQEVYHALKTKPYALQCNNHGWTQPLIAFAQKDNQPLLKTIAERVQQHAQSNKHTKLAEEGKSFTGTVRCFTFRTPFEANHRELVQRAAALVPFTGLHYVHSTEHPPLLIASVLTEQEAYEKFEQENPLVRDPDVHVFADGEAAAFLEYVHEVVTDNRRLKTKHITSDLAQFYKEHDEHQARLRSGVSGAWVHTQLPAELNAEICTFLTNEHPEPLAAPQAACVPPGAAAAAATK